VLVSGEGWSVGAVAPDDNRPGGFKVRLRKLDGASKSVLKRAHERARGDQATSTKASPENTSAVREPMARAAEPIPITSLVRGKAEKSGIRHRPHAPVPAPPNRDELLARLRARARERASEADHGFEKAAG
jgi:hypothetical protein